jgi:hypothetical protein
MTKSYKFGVDFHRPYADIYEIQNREILFSGYEHQGTAKKFRVRKENFKLGIFIIFFTGLCK